MKKVFISVCFLLVVLLPIFANISSDEFWKDKPTLDQVNAELANCSNIEQVDMYLNTALMSAVTNETSLEIISLLIESGADVNAINLYGQNSLLCALETNDSLDIAKLLLERKADINIIEPPFYDTSLSTVLERNASKEFVNFVLDNGFDFNLKSFGSFNAYELIAMYGDLDLVSHFINKYEVSGTLLDQMLIPSVFNDSSVFAYLLDLGADVEYESEYFGSPINVIANMCDDPSIIKVVFDKLIMTQEQKLDLLLSVAKSTQDPQILEAFANEGLSFTEYNENHENVIFNVFANNKNKDVFDYVIETENIVELYHSKDEDYDVIAFFAMYNNEPSLIPYLQEKLELDEIDMNYLFNLSATNSDYTILKWLEKQGYYPMNSNNDDSFFFSLAALINPIVENIEYLITHFNPTQDALNEMLIYAIVDNPNIEVVKYLLSFDLDINKENEVFGTPLACACYYAYEPEMIDLLIASGADAKLRSNGILPKKYARKNEDIYLTPSYWRLVYKTYN